MATDPNPAGSAPTVPDLPGPGLPGPDPEAAPPGRRAWTRRQTLVAWLPAMVLSTVALSQITCAKTSVLAPWKGGGFGMFATIDSISKRPLRVFAEVNGERRTVVLPRSTRRVYSGVRGYPSDRALGRVARELEPYVLEQEAEAAAISVEVWRSVFEPETSTLRFVRWRAVRREIEKGDTAGLGLDLDQDALEAR